VTHDVEADVLLHVHEASAEAWPAAAMFGKEIAARRAT